MSFVVCLFIYLCIIVCIYTVDTYVGLYVYVLIYLFMYLFALFLDFCPLESSNHCVCHMQYFEYFLLYNY